MDCAEASNDTVAGVRGCWSINASFREGTPLLLQERVQVMANLLYALSMTARSSLILGKPHGHRPRLQNTYGVKSIVAIELKNRSCSSIHSHVHSGRDAGV